MLTALRAITEGLTEPFRSSPPEPHPSVRLIGVIDPQLIRVHPGLARADAESFAREELETLFRNHECYTLQSARTGINDPAEYLPYYATLRKKAEMAKTRVFKLQRPLATTEPGPEQVLAYDQHRQFNLQMPMTDEIRQLFGDAYKVFVNATPKGGELLILGPVRAREW